MERKIARAAVVVNGLALDELHHVERQTVVAHSTIKETRDVRMFERGEYLPLVAEAARDGVGVEATQNDFDGHLLLEVAVVADRGEDSAHPASSYFARDAITPDTPAFQPCAFSERVGRKW